MKHYRILIIIIGFLFAGCNTKESPTVNSSSVSKEDSNVLNARNSLHEQMKTIEDELFRVEAQLKFAPNDSILITERDGLEEMKIKVIEMQKVSEEIKRRNVMLKNLLFDTLQ